MFYINIFVLLSFFFFILSIVGLITSKNNMLYVLICLEVQLLASNLIFVASSCFFGDITGQIFVLVTLTVGASESIVGLSLLIFFYKMRGVIDYKFVNLIKG
jgi:NADH-quinone oxidoreductase subunit K